MSLRCHETSDEERLVSGREKRPEESVVTSTSQPLTLATMSVRLQRSRLAPLSWRATHADRPAGTVAGRATEMPATEEDSWSEVVSVYGAAVKERLRA